MIIIVTALQDAVDIHLASIAAANLEADHFARGGLRVDGGRNLQFGHQPAELLILGQTSPSLTS